MRWLVSARASASLSHVAERLRDLGSTEVDIESAVPMGSDEVVIPVDGPNDLPTLIADDPVLISAFNDSDVTLYE